MAWPCGGPAGAAAQAQVARASRPVLRRWRPRMAQSRLWLPPTGAVRDGFCIPSSRTTSKFVPWPCRSLDCSGPAVGRCGNSLAQLPEVLMPPPPAMAAHRAPTAGPPAADASRRSMPMRASSRWASVTCAGGVAEQGQRGAPRDQPAQVGGEAPVQREAERACQVPGRERRAGAQVCHPLPADRGPEHPLAGAGQWLYLAGGSHLHTRNHGSATSRATGRPPQASSSCSARTLRPLTSGRTSTSAGVGVAETQDGESAAALPGSRSAARGTSRAARELIR